MYWLKTVLILTTVVVISACSEIPKKDMQSYVVAYGQAKDAAEEVMIELSVARETIKKYQAKQAEAAAAARDTRRVAYVPPVRGARTNGENGIAARLAALSVIDQYNQLLVAIAEGKNQDRIKEQVTTIANVAGKVAQLAGAAIPGLPALTGLLQTLAGEYQKYRDRKLFAQKLRDGTPYVKQILDFLIDDTPTIVNVHEGIWDIADAKLRRRPTSIARQILAKVRIHKVPPAGTLLKRAQAQEKDASESLSGFSGEKITFKWSNTADASPPNATFLNELEAAVASMKEAISAYTVHQEKYESLRALMDHYTTLLKQTIDSIDAVAMALDKPIDMSATIIGLLESAQSIKLRFSAYRAALRAT